MFTRRHYEAIAEVLKEYFAEQDYAETHDIRPRPSIEGALATMFEADNPRFDYVRFYNACEPVE
jgi:hypothetical protein|tara:strand:+ start:225 stop:416 length:192 start_codon:yes stop_codon:yes gene_type:complete